MEFSGGRGILVIFLAMLGFFHQFANVSSAVIVPRTARRRLQSTTTMATTTTTAVPLFINELVVTEFENVSLPCSVSPTEKRIVFWTHYTRPKPTTLFAGPASLSKNPRFTVQNSTLHITAVSREDAGYFSCALPKAQPMASYQLVVLNATTTTSDVITTDSTMLDSTTMDATVTDGNTTEATVTDVTTMDATVTSVTSTEATVTDAIIMDATVLDSTTTPESAMIAENEMIVVTSVPGAFNSHEDHDVVFFDHSTVSATTLSDTNNVITVQAEGLESSSTTSHIDEDSSTRPPGAMRYEEEPKRSYYYDRFKPDDHSKEIYAEYDADAEDEDEEGFDEVHHPHSHSSHSSPTITHLTGEVLGNEEEEEGDGSHHSSKGNLYESGPEREETFIEHEMRAAAESSNAPRKIIQYPTVVADDEPEVFVKKFAYPSVSYVKKPDGLNVEVIDSTVLKAGAVSPTTATEAPPTTTTTTTTEESSTTTTTEEPSTTTEAPPTTTTTTEESFTTTTTTTKASPVLITSGTVINIDVPVGAFDIMVNITTNTTVGTIEPVFSTTIATTALPKSTVLALHSSSCVSFPAVSLILALCLFAL